MQDAGGPPCRMPASIVSREALVAGSYPATHFTVPRTPRTHVLRVFDPTHPSHARAPCFWEDLFVNMQLAEVAEGVGKRWLITTIYKQGTAM